MRGPAVFLVALGLAQMTGDVLGIDGLRAIAAATTASPAPKVFSAVDGLETYSSRFFLEWDDPLGRPQSFQLTPETYQHLRGPYNRRNPYGAVFAYGPILVSNPATRPLFEGVARYALCGDAPLLAELGVPVTDRAGNLRVRIVPGPGSAPGDLPMLIEAPCL